MARVQRVAGDPHAGRGDDAAERQDRHLGGAAADVDDHRPGRLVDRQPGTDRSGHRLADGVHPARAGGVGRLAHRALLDAGDAGRHAHDDPRTGERAAPAQHLADEVAQHLVRKVLRRRGAFTGPRIVICVPSGITTVEQRAVSESAYAAGARRVHIISEPMAAAIGAGLPVNQPAGSMVIDIGGGTTEVAILAMGGIVAATSLRVAGNAIDQAIVDYVRSEFSLLVGERTAEELKISVGSAFPVAGPRSAEIRGRDVGTGLPRNVTINGDELRKAMDAPLVRIITAVRATLDRCPRSCPATWSPGGSCSPGAGRCCAGWTRGCSTSSASRCWSPTARSTPSCWAPPRSWSTSSSCRKWSSTATVDSAVAACGG